MPVACRLPPVARFPLPASRLLNLALAALVLPSDPARTYSGRDGRLDVSPPRIQAEIVVDGRLAEPAWNDAALLTGFSLYAPVDGRPAPDSTEVLVWYSAKAIHFGIRAFAEPGSVRASLGDRDKSYSDDYIGIFLTPTRSSARTCDGASRATSRSTARFGQTSPRSSRTPDR